ncbi:MAG: hypothetical protein ACKVXR_15640 [Planctomycetota bacterium]
MAAFLGLFALDVFEHEEGLGQILVALAIHLIPSFVLVAAVLLAWRRPWVGACLFGAAALGYALMVGRTHLDWIALVSGPLLLTAVLYFLSWDRNPRRQARGAE